MISRDARKRYLNHPFACPFCRSDDISAGEKDASEDSREMTQRVDCKNHECGKSWKEIYRLADVVEDAEFD